MESIGAFFRILFFLKMVRGLSLTGGRRAEPEEGNPGLP